MTVNDLVHRLEGNARYDYRVESNGSVSVADLGIVMVEDGEEMHPVTNFTPEALDGLTWPQVIAHAAQGRDVDHITRVTGYFSKTSQWNPSKTGELRDRHRVRIE